MADSKLVINLDKKLIDDGIIDPNFKEDYKKVHSMLNTHVRKSGKILTEETFRKGDERLRKWLMVLYKKGASQEKLSSYLRCGLAHLCYDFIESTYKSISTEDLITRALQSFKKRNFHKTFFKVSPSKTARSKKKKKAVKKVAIKKSIKKKTSAKKISKGKASSKKITKKKAATKKVAAKKPRIKKSKTKSKKVRKKKNIISKILGI